MYIKPYYLKKVYLHTEVIYDKKQMFFPWSCEGDIAHKYGDESIQKNLYANFHASFYANSLYDCLPFPSMG